LTCTGAHAGASTHTIEVVQGGAGGRERAIERARERERARESARERERAREREADRERARARARERERERERERDQTPHAPKVAAYATKLRSLRPQ
jgi:hypothetical protein